MSAGKGDAPRRVNLKVYRENYDAIDWGRDSSDEFMRSLGFREMTPMESEQDSHFFECRESHLEFMRAMGYECATEAEAYRLRGLLDL